MAAFFFNSQKKIKEKSSLFSPNLFLGLKKQPDNPASLHDVGRFCNLKCRHVGLHENS